MKMVVQNMEEITLGIITKVVDEIVKAPIISTAPLGYSSKTIVVYGSNGNERRNGVSIRNHSGMVKMLMCDSDGYFIYHGGYDKDLPVKLIGKELYKTFKLLKSHIQLKQ